MAEKMIKNGKITLYKSLSNYVQETQIIFKPLLALRPFSAFYF